MSDTTDQDVPISFVRWLHAQAKSDQSRSMPYARIYNWGRQIHALLGSDGVFGSEFIALELAKQGATEEDLSALVSAEAAWRVDTVIENAEAAGVPLDMGDTDVVSSSVSKTLEATEAVVLCGYRNHRGEGCVSHAVPGAGRCGAHGGAITDPEVRRSFLLIAFAKVIDGSREAVDALLDVAVNGRSEMARVQAAKEILDRSGVQQDQHVHIHRPEEDSSEDEMLNTLRNRLLETKNRLRLTAVDAAGTELELMPARYVPESDIIDAEIVGDREAASG